MAAGRCDVIPGRVEDANPESRDSPMCNCTSEVWSFGPSRNDERWIASSRSLSSGAHPRDPLAPRNDVAPISNMTPRSRGVIRPRFARTVRASINRGRRESRVPNAPAASRAKCNEHTSVVTTGTPEQTRPSLRKGAYGRRKRIQINVMRPLCSHLCRDPVLVSMPKETWGHIDAYEAMWSD